MNILYDYYDDNLQASVFFIIITLICLFALIFLIVHGIKVIKKTGFCMPSIFWLCSIIVVFIITVPCSYNAYRLLKFDYVYINNRYETVVGNLQVLEIERNDYRDLEQYDVTFSVDDVLFDNTNSFSKEQKDQIIKEDNKIVEVQYSYIGKQRVVYRVIVERIE